LTPRCGLDVQNPTQELKSVKGPGNTFHINPKWERTLPFFGIFSQDIYRVPPSNPNIKVATAGCQISTLIFGFGGEDSINIL
jgi:hypothetical protein